MNLSQRFELVNKHDDAVAQVIGAAFFCQPFVNAEFDWEANEGAINVSE